MTGGWVIGVAAAWEIFAYWLIDGMAWVRTRSGRLGGGALFIHFTVSKSLGRRRCSRAVMCGEASTYISSSLVCPLHPTGSSLGGVPRAVVGCQVSVETAEQRGLTLSNLTTQC